ncbi:MAG: peptidase M14 family protein, partial [Kordiimonadaceae bacterium]|nr:peptidase M14 family protein [Kordiimonadaceae bacterium]
RLVEYYQLVGAESDRMKVVDMGDTEMGQPFLALYISTPKNLARLDEIKAYNDKLVDPRGIAMSEIDEAVENSVAIVVQSFGIHSNEVAAPQTAAETVYDLLTRDDEDMTRILNETLSIFIPAFNPDGQKMVVDWYNSNVGTEYETSPLPWLYHKYIGHDTNRDAFATNMASSGYGAEILFTEWNPQSYIDHHQMGAYSARLYVPPYAEPIRPAGDPLVWREMSWYGAHISQDEEINGKTGVINGAYYTGWGHFGFHWITPFHNIAGMLTESASTRLGTPIYIHPDQLEGARYNFPKYDAQINFPNPWPGGWWRVRDIVEQQKIAALALLDLTAKNRKLILKNSYLKASRQTERGKNLETKAYIIPADQHDPLTMEKMINILLGQGIEVKKAAADFTHEDHNYKAGSYVVTMAQPKQGLVRWLLGRTFYPDNFYTRDVDGSPKRPYDMSTDNISEYMGVDVKPVGTDVMSGLTVVADKVHSLGDVVGSANGYVIDGRLNEAFTAVNLLWDAGVDVSRIDEDGNGLRAGDFIIPAVGQGDLLGNIARETGVNFKALAMTADGLGRPMERLKVGLYGRYLAGNMDEGWTRFLLEQYKFPFDQLYDKDLTNSNLRKYDVVIMPSDNMARLTGSNEEYAEQFPPEYRSGLKDDETEALDEFVKNGGSLVMLGDAGEYAIDKFKLPITNVVDGIDTKDFWSPGSTLRMTFNNDNPIAYGMPDEGVALFLVSNDVYQVKKNTKNYRVSRIATYKDRDILESGWLLGEDHIAEKAVGVAVTHGEGDIVLTGIRPQFRAQTHGTFKILFNSLVSRK